MKNTIVLLLILGVATLLPAQNIRVVDAADQTPIERVSVSNLETLKFATSNDKGLIDGALLAIADSSSRFEFRCMGYQILVLTKSEIADLNYIIPLFPAQLSLDEVVISATRWNQSSRELPFKIKTLKAKEVLFQNPQTAADLLGQTGEVFIQKSQQGGGSPMIRGFATNRLLLAVDGVRMNNAIFRSGNLQNVIAIDPYAVERTEVYFGPGSVIYGSDAIGGVMSFQTLSAQLSTSKKMLVTGKANTRFASANNELSSHFDINLGWQKWALRTSITHNRFGDLRMGSQGPEAYLNNFYVQTIDSSDKIIQNRNPQVQKFTGYEQTNLMQKVRFKPNSTWDFVYALHHSETSDNNRYDRLIELRDGKPRSAQWYYGPQVWQMHLAEANYSKRSLLADRATLRTAYQYFEESRNSRNFQSPVLEQRVEKVRAYTANLDILKRVSARHKLFYGAEAVFNNVESRGNSSQIFTGQKARIDDRYPQSTWQSYALYFNHEWELTEKITSQIGARYNQFLVDADFTRNLDFVPLPYSSARLNKGALTGSAGIVFRPSESLKLRANFGTAFRAPNVDDIGKVFDSSNDILVVPNANLEAEYAYNAEIGAAWLLDQKLKLDATVYYTYLDNALVRRPFSLAGADSLSFNGRTSALEAVQNAAFSSVFGFQAGFEWQIGGGFSLSSQVNYQKGQEELEDGSISPARHAAPWFGLSRLNFEQKKIRLQLYSQYSGGITAGNLNAEEATKDHLYLSTPNGKLFSPGWYTLNFKASYQISKKISVTAGFENITDQRYLPYSSGIVAAGRNMVMAIQAQF
jgi:hemoglobin/transferrin/lactoferrin receptor protein